MATPDGHWLCASGALTDGGDGIRFEVDCGQQDWQPAFVVRFRGEVHAYLNRCAHQPAELDWLPGRFFDHEGWHLICALHGALYAPDTGVCVAGPCAGARLPVIGVVEHDGQVWCVAPVRREQRDPREP